MCDIGESSGRGHRAYVLPMPFHMLCSTNLRSDSAGTKKTTNLIPEGDRDLHAFCVLTLYNTIILPQAEIMATEKVQVNGSTSGHDPDVQSQIITALLQNGGVARIQQKLRERLDEDGWSQNLREYIVKLFRSGEVETFEQAEKKVYQAIRVGGAMNGAGGGVCAPDLSIPQTAKDGGVEAVKKELRNVCKMDNK